MKAKFQNIYIKKKPHSKTQAKHCPCGQPSIGQLVGAACCAGCRDKHYINAKREQRYKLREAQLRLASSEEYSLSASAEHYNFVKQ